MITVSEFANSVNLSVEIILNLCKNLNINVNSGDDLLSESDVELLNEELAEISFSHQSNNGNSLNGNSGDFTYNNPSTGAGGADNNVDIDKAALYDGIKKGKSLKEALESLKSTLESITVKPPVSSALLSSAQACARAAISISNSMNDRINKVKSLIYDDDAMFEYLFGENGLALKYGYDNIDQLMVDYAKNENLSKEQRKELERYLEFKGELINDMNAGKFIIQDEDGYAYQDLNALEQAVVGAGFSMQMFGQLSSSMKSYNSQIDGIKNENKKQDEEAKGITVDKNSQQYGLGMRILEDGYIYDEKNNELYDNKGRRVILDGSSEEYRWDIDSKRYIDENGKEVIVVDALTIGTNGNNYSDKDYNVDKDGNSINVDVGTLNNRYEKEAYDIALKYIALKECENYSLVITNSSMVDNYLYYYGTQYKWDIDSKKYVDENGKEVSAAVVNNNGVAIIKWYDEKGNEVSEDSENIAITRYFDADNNEILTRNADGSYTFEDLEGFTKFCDEEFGRVNDEYLSVKTNPINQLSEFMNSDNRVSFNSQTIIGGYYTIEDSNGNAVRTYTDDIYSLPDDLRATLETVTVGDVVKAAGLEEEFSELYSSTDGTFIGEDAEKFIENLNKASTNVSRIENEYLSLKNDYVSSIEEINVVLNIRNSALNNCYNSYDFNRIYNSQINNDKISDEYQKILSGYTYLSNNSDGISGSAVSNAVLNVTNDADLGVIYTAIANGTAKVSGDGLLYYEKDGIYIKVENAGIDMQTWNEFSKVLTTADAEEIVKTEQNTDIVSGLINKATNWFKNNVFSAPELNIEDCKNLDSDEVQRVVDGIKESASIASLDPTSGNVFNVTAEQSKYIVSSILSGSSEFNVNGTSVSYVDSETGQTIYISSVANCIENALSEVNNTTSVNSFLNSEFVDKYYNNYNYLNDINYVYNVGIKVDDVKLTGGEAVNYLVNSVDSSLAGTLNSRAVSVKESFDKEFAYKFPELASATSVVLGPFEGTRTFAYAVDKAFNESNNTPIYSVNTYSSSDVIRGQVSSNISENNGEFASLFYSTVMSMADNAYNSALFGAVGLPMGIGLALNSFDNSYNDAISRGINQQNAFNYALALAALEGATEQMSWDNLSKLTGSNLTDDAVMNAINNTLATTIKVENGESLYSVAKIITGIASQSGSEGFEELVSSVGGRFIDIALNGSNSTQYLKYQELLSQGKSTEEAMKQIALENLYEDIQSTLSGMMSGGMMSTNGVITNNISTEGQLVNSLEYNLANGNFDTSFNYINDYLSTSSNKIASDTQFKTNLENAFVNNDYSSAIDQILNNSSISSSVKINASSIIINTLSSTGQINENVSKDLNSKVENYVKLVEEINKKYNEKIFSDMKAKLSENGINPRNMSLETMIKKYPSIYQEVINGNNKSNIEGNSSLEQNTETKVEETKQDTFTELEILGEMQSRLDSMGISTENKTLDDLKIEHNDVYQEVVNEYRNKENVNSSENISTSDNVVENSNIDTLGLLVDGHFEMSNVDGKIELSGENVIYRFSEEKVNDLLIKYEGKNLSDDKVLEQFESDLKSIENVDVVHKGEIVDSGSENVVRTGTTVAGALGAGIISGLGNTNTDSDGNVSSDSSTGGNNRLNDGDSKNRLMDKLEASKKYLLSESSLLSNFYKNMKSYYDGKYGNSIHNIEDALNLLLDLNDLTDEQLENLSMYENNKVIEFLSKITYKDDFGEVVSILYNNGILERIISDIDDKTLIKSIFKNIKYFNDAKILFKNMSVKNICIAIYSSYSTVTSELWRYLDLCKSLNIEITTDSILYFFENTDSVLLDLYNRYYLNLDMSNSENIFEFIDNDIGFILDNIGVDLYDFISNNSSLKSLLNNKYFLEQMLLKYFRDLTVIDDLFSSISNELRHELILSDKLPSNMKDYLKLNLSFSNFISGIKNDTIDLGIKEFTLFNGRVVTISELITYIENNDILDSFFGSIITGNECFKKITNLELLFSIVELFKSFDNSIYKFSCNNNALNQFYEFYNEYLFNADDITIIEGLSRLNLDSSKIYTYFNDTIYVGDIKSGVDQHAIADVFDILNLSDPYYIKMSELLIKQVQNKFPGMSSKLAKDFLRRIDVNSSKGGTGGICNYADVANFIFEKFKNNSKLFEQKFGFPMYIDGKLNDAQLLCDMFINISETLIIENNKRSNSDVVISKDYKYTFVDKNYINLCNCVGEIDSYKIDLISEYLYNKGIIDDTSKINQYSLIYNMSGNKRTNWIENRYLENTILLSIESALKNGHHISISSGLSYVDGKQVSGSFDLYDLNNLDGIKPDNEVRGAHIMSVYGVYNGKILLESWGKRYYIKISDMLSMGTKFTIDGITSDGQVLGSDNFSEVIDINDSINYMASIDKNNLASNLKTIVTNIVNGTSNKSDVNVESNYSDELDEYDLDNAVGGVTYDYGKERLNSSKLKYSIDDILADDDLFKKFNDFENNKELFGIDLREEYIKILDKYLFEDGNLDKINEQQILRCLYINEFRERIISSEVGIKFFAKYMPDYSYLIFDALKGIESQLLLNNKGFIDAVLSMDDRIMLRNIKGEFIYLYDNDDVFNKAKLYDSRYYYDGYVNYISSFKEKLSLVNFDRLSELIGYYVDNYYLDSSKDLIFIICGNLDNVTFSKLISEIDFTEYGFKRILEKIIENIDNDVAKIANINNFNLIISNYIENNKYTDDTVLNYYIDNILRVKLLDNPSLLESDNVKQFFNKRLYGDSIVKIQEIINSKSIQNYLIGKYNNLVSRNISTIEDIELLMSDYNNYFEIFDKYDLPFNKNLIIESENVQSLLDTIIQNNVNLINSVNILSKGQIHDLISTLTILQSYVTINNCYKLENLYDCVNKRLVESNGVVDLEYFKQHILNFSDFFAKQNGLEIEFKIKYEDNNTMGSSSVYYSIITYNEKYFTEIGHDRYDNIFISVLETMFHEVTHQIQKNNSKNGIINKYTLTESIDRIIREVVGKEYYNINYHTISYEIDARYKSQFLLYNYLKKISSDNAFNKYNEIIKNKFNKEMKLYSFYSNFLSIDNKIKLRDILLDEIVYDNIVNGKNSKFLDENSILKNIYNEDGSRKNILQLLEIRNNSTDVDIIEMINDRIKNCSYSFDGLISEMYNILSNNFENNSEIDDIIDDLSDFKLIETLIYHFNYFSDYSMTRDDYISQIDKSFKILQDKYLDDHENISHLRNLLIDEFNEVYDNRFMLFFENASSNVLVGYIENNSNNLDFINNIGEFILNHSIDYDLYINLINISNPNLFPYLSQNKEYFSRMFIKNINNLYDVIVNIVFSHIDTSRMHEYITIDMYNAMDKNTRNKFDSMYPGIREKIFESNGVATIIEEDNAWIEDEDFGIDEDTIIDLSDVVEEVKRIQNASNELNVNASMSERKSGFFSSLFGKNRNNGRIVSQQLGDNLFNIDDIINGKNIVSVDSIKNVDNMSRDELNKILSSNRYNSNYKKSAVLSMYLMDINLSFNSDSVDIIYNHLLYKLSDSSISIDERTKILELLRSISIENDGRFKPVDTLIDYQFKEKSKKDILDIKKRNSEFSLEEFYSSNSNESNGAVICFTDNQVVSILNDKAGAGPHIEAYQDIISSVYGMDYVRNKRGAVNIMDIGNSMLSIFKQSSIEIRLVSEGNSIPQYIVIFPKSISRNQYNLFKAYVDKYGEILSKISHNLGDEDNGLIFCLAADVQGHNMSDLLGYAESIVDDSIKLPSERNIIGETLDDLVSSDGSTYELNDVKSFKGKIGIQFLGAKNNNLLSSKTIESLSIDERKNVERFLRKDIYDVTIEEYERYRLVVDTVDKILENAPDGYFKDGKTRDEFLFGKGNIYENSNFIEIVNKKNGVLVDSIAEYCSDDINKIREIGFYNIIDAINSFAISYSNEHGLDLNLESDELLIKKIAATNPEFYEGAYDTISNLLSDKIKSAKNNNIAVEIDLVDIVDTLGAKLMNADIRDEDGFIIHSVKSEKRSVEKVYSDWYNQLVKYGYKLKSYKVVDGSLSITRKDGTGKFTLDKDGNLIDIETNTLVNDDKGNVINLDFSKFIPKDLLRFTIIANEGNYTDTVVNTIRMLEQKGYNIEKAKLDWPNKDNKFYQGVNLTLNKDGQVFELQLHTNYSFYAKDDGTHLFYEVKRNDAFKISDDKKILSPIQIVSNYAQYLVQDQVIVPDNAHKLYDCKNEVESLIKQGKPIGDYLLEKVNEESTSTNVEQYVYDSFVESDIIFDESNIDIQEEVVEIQEPTDNSLSSVLDQGMEYNEEEDSQIGNEYAIEIDGYKVFSKDFATSIRQMGNHFGDAGINSQELGRKINEMFLQGKTASMIVSLLEGNEKIEFENYLNNTIEGRFLSKIEDSNLIKAVSIYTRIGYNNINSALRIGNMDGSIKYTNPKTLEKESILVKDLIESIDKVISLYGGLDSDTVLYRATGLSAFIKQNEPFRKAFESIQNKHDVNEIFGVLRNFVGFKFSDKGYMSTSPGYNTSFAKKAYPIVLEILAPEGTPGAYLNQISKQYNVENEFLLDKGTTLKIVDVKLYDDMGDYNAYDRVVVRCEVVSDNVDVKVEESIVESMMEYPGMVMDNGDTDGDLEYISEDIFYEDEEKVYKLLDNLISEGKITRGKLSLYAEFGRINWIPVECRDVIKDIDRSIIKSYISDTRGLKIDLQYFGGLSESTGQLDNSVVDDSVDVEFNVDTSKLDADDVVGFLQSYIDVLNDDLKFKQVLDKLMEYFDKIYTDSSYDVTDGKIYYALEDIYLDGTIPDSFKISLLEKIIQSFGSSIRIDFCNEVIGQFFFNVLNGKNVDSILYGDVDINILNAKYSSIYLINQYLEDIHSIIDNNDFLKYIVNNYLDIEKILIDNLIDSYISSCCNVASTRGNTIKLVCEFDNNGIKINGLFKNDLFERLLKLGGIENLQIVLVDKVEVSSNRVGAVQANDGKYYVYNDTKDINIKLNQVIDNFVHSFDPSSTVADFIDTMGINDLFDEFNDKAHNLLNLDIYYDTYGIDFIEYLNNLVANGGTVVNYSGNISNIQILGLSVTEIRDFLISKGLFVANYGMLDSLLVQHGNNFVEYLNNLVANNGTVVNYSGNISFNINIISSISLNEIRMYLNIKGLYLPNFNNLESIFAMVDGYTGVKEGIKFLNEFLDGVYSTISVPSSYHSLISGVSVDEIKKYLITKGWYIEKISRLNRFVSIGNNNVINHFNSHSKYGIALLNIYAAGGIDYIPNEYFYSSTSPAFQINRTIIRERTIDEVKLYLKMLNDYFVEFPVGYHKNDLLTYSYEDLKIMLQLIPVLGGKKISWNNVLNNYIPEYEDAAHTVLSFNHFDPRRSRFRDADIREFYIFSNGRRLKVVIRWHTPDPLAYNLYGSAARSGIMDTARITIYHRRNVQGEWIDAIYLDENGIWSDNQLWNTDNRVHIEKID